MEKNRTTIMIIGIILILGIYFVRKIDFNYEYNKDITLVDEYISDSEVDIIRLKLYSTDVILKESNDDKVKISYYSNQENNGKIEYLDNTITIDEEEQDVSCTGFCSIKRYVEVYVPTSYNGSYKINTVSGDIKSEINLNNNVNIVTTSGDIYLNEVSDLDITTTSGDIYIDTLTDKTNIITTSGTIHIDTLHIIENSSIITTSGDVLIKDNQSECYIDTNTNSGDIKVNNNNRKSDIILKIKTTSGDIIVS